MDPDAVLASFMKAHKLPSKTREKFAAYLLMKGVDCGQEDELEEAMQAYRRLLHAATQKRREEAHGHSQGASKLRMQKYRADAQNRALEQERKRLRRADQHAIEVAKEARTRARKAQAEGPIVALDLAASAQEVLKTMAAEAMAAAANRCALDWPCYILVVKDFVQRLDRAQPDLHLLPDMRTFFAALGECARKSEVVRGEKERKFRQLNFDPATFELSPTVDACLKPAQRLQIKRFFSTFNQILRAFLEALLDRCTATDAVWAVSLRQDLTHILGQANFKRLASFLLRYTPTGGTAQGEGQKGLSVHVDHADPVGSVLLGGSRVSEAQPCVAIYPTHATVFGPELKPLEISYSAGDLVFFNGSFAHGSVIAVPDRLLYSQFLATSQ